MNHQKKGIGNLNKTSTTSSTCIGIKGRDLVKCRHGDTLSDAVDGFVREQITLNIPIKVLHKDSL